jgi:apolipoprotein N-acyltransferase
MTEFMRAAVGFPGVCFGLLLAVVLAYWLLVAFGVLDVMIGPAPAVLISVFA